jgi:DNA repair exonuclease SbcCD ATPase subunit
MAEKVTQEVVSAICDRLIADNPNASCSYDQVNKALGEDRNPNKRKLLDMIIQWREDKTAAVSIDMSFSPAVAKVLSDDKAQAVQQADAKSEQRIADAVQAKNDALDELGATEKELEKAQADLKVIGERIVSEGKTHSAEVAAAEQRIENLKMSLLDLKDIESELNKTQQNLAAAEMGRSNAEERFADAEALNVNLQGEVKKLTGEVGKLDTRLSGEISKVTSLNDRLTESKASEKTLIGQVKTLSNELASAEKATAIAGEKLSGAEGQGAKLSLEAGKVDGLEKALTAETKKATDAQLATEKEHTLVKLAEKDNKQLTTRAKELEAKIQALEAELKKSSGKK